MGIKLSNTPKLACRNPDENRLFCILHLIQLYFNMWGIPVPGLDIGSLMQWREVHVDYAALVLVAGALCVADGALQLTGLVDDEYPGGGNADRLVGYDIVWSVAIPSKVGRVAGKKPAQTGEAAYLKKFRLAVDDLLLEGSED